MNPVGETLTPMCVTCQYVCNHVIRRLGASFPVPTLDRYEDTGKLGLSIRAELADSDIRGLLASDSVEVTPPEVLAILAVGVGVGTINRIIGADHR